MIKISPYTQPHMFMPGETIEAIIKKTNRHDANQIELEQLIREYRLINGIGVPRAGTQALIPVLARHQTEVFGKKWLPLALN